MNDTDGTATGLGTRIADNNHRAMNLTLPWTEAAQNKLNTVSRRSGRKMAESLRDVCEHVARALGYEVVPVVLVIEASKMMGALVASAAVMESE